MIRVSCSNCGAAFDTMEQYAGREATCTNCGARFVIPQVSAPLQPSGSAPASPAIAAAPQNAPVGHSSISIAGLICGIIGLLLPFIPCVGLFALAVALAGIVCSIIGLVTAKKANRKKSIPLAGLIVSIVALIWIPLLVFVLLGSLIGAAGLSSL